MSGGTKSFIFAINRYSARKYHVVQPIPGHNLAMLAYPCLHACIHHQLYHSRANTSSKTNFVTENVISEGKKDTNLAMKNIDATARTDA